MPPTLLSDDDLYLFNEGSHYRLYEKLGAHPVADSTDGPGTSFAVWAPDAQAVSVIGEFNGWNASTHPLNARGSSGIWEGFLRGVDRGALYKYHVVSRLDGSSHQKTDPFAFLLEEPPRTASIVWDPRHEWRDEAWMRERRARNALSAPIAIYEVHLGSFQREGGRSLSYRELAPRLADRVRSLGFTHVELLPVMEHPFYGSWGYQVSGYFAPTHRLGKPEDLMVLIDTLHREGIGVILDWVPAHFPQDPHSLYRFDGTHLYEHADPRKGFHPDWKSAIFNYGRHEVQSFLLSSALFWLDRYHADGLRVDAVASMLYLDYSRSAGEWVPNAYGGRENIEAIAFLRRLNEAVYANYPDVQMVAEESTAWPMVSRPTYAGGLGFGLKWDLGWMHDTLSYFARDPVHRKFHHQELTFRGLYAFTENFLLPLSHDEVVHGKGSLLAKMPGDEWQKFANLRLLYAALYAQPGKKLLFMGSELAPWTEWNHEEGLDGTLLYRPLHAGIFRWLADLNRLYRAEPALHARDVLPEGFQWIDASDSEQSVTSFLRFGPAGSSPVLVVSNFTPVPRWRYRVGVPQDGYWRERLNGDAHDYGGSGLGNLGGAAAEGVPWHGQPFSLSLTLPPLAALFLQPEA